MKLKLLAFGIAKDILGAPASDFEVRSGSTVGDLRAALTGRYQEFSKLASVAFAVNETYVTDDRVLHEGDEVVIIPPVSGG